MLVDFLHAAHADHLDAEVFFGEALAAVPGDDDLFKAQFLGFGYALLYAVHGADLAAEAYFAGKTDVVGDGYVFVRRKQRSKYGQVNGGVFYFKPAGDVEEHVL